MDHFSPTFIWPFVWVLNKQGKSLLFILRFHMGYDVRKPVFRGLQTTMAQTSLHIRAVWSAPLLFAYWKVSYLNLLQVKFNFLASLWSWGDWFESRSFWNPEEGLSNIAAHIKCKVLQVFIAHENRYSKTCLKRALKNRQNKDLNDKWKLN